MHVYLIRQIITRVNFSEMVQKRFGGLNIGECHMHACIYLCKNIIGGLNISNFIQKLPIVKIFLANISSFMVYV